MKKYIIISFLVSLVANTVQSAGCPGCPWSLQVTEENKEKLNSLAKAGVDKIYKKKLAENSLPSCVGLEGKFLSGTKQVVAGLKYVLQVQVKPIKSTEADCAASNVDPNSVPIETCEITVVERAWESEQPEIKFVCPTPKKPA